MMPQKDDNNEPTVVAAYYMPRRGVTPGQLPLDKLTHIILSFSHVIDGEMKFRNPRMGEIVSDLVSQKQNYPNLKVMVACGGWGADGFSDMAETEESREKFAESTLRFVEEYRLDGIDMDWEYPGLEAAGIKHRPEDTQRFTLVMKAIREKFNTIDREIILTFAAAGWKRYYEHIETTEVMKYADYINIMTYDQVSGNSKYTGHHTALGLITSDDIKGTPLYGFMEENKGEIDELGYRYEPRSAEKILDYVIGLGVDPARIIIGAAFYGRSWKGVPPENNGLYQTNQGVHTGWGSYAHIRAELENKSGYVRYWDPVAKAPWLYNAADSIFITYDDTASVRLKTEYAVEKKLGGIMFWQLSDDTKEEKSLLDAIYHASQKVK